MFKSIALIALLFFTMPLTAQELDPTRPLDKNYSASLPKSAPNYTLQSIIYEDKQKQHIKKAVINGKLLKVGDTIGPFKLKSIGPNKVVIANSQSRLVLSLYTPVVTKSL